jgi:hypothetical protein
VIGARGLEVKLAGLAHLMFEAVDAAHGSRYKLRAFVAAKTSRHLRGTIICKRFCHPNSNARWS